MAFLHPAAEGVALHVGVSILKGQIGWEVGGDAAAAKLHGIGPKLFKMLDFYYKIHVDVDVAQVVLHHAQVVFEPPSHVFLPPFLCSDASIVQKEEGKRKQAAHEKGPRCTAGRRIYGEKGRQMQ